MIGGTGKPHWVASMNANVRIQETETEQLEFVFAVENENEKDQLLCCFAGPSSSALGIPIFQLKGTGANYTGSSFHIPPWIDSSFGFPSSSLTYFSFLEIGVLILTKDQCGI